MVVLATAATVIASQAVISGAFSVSRQAVQLGLLPPLRIRQTSEHEAGQVYLPAVNWALFAGVLVLILAFRSSERLATAYGIAVTGALLVDTVLLLVVARRRWHWRPWQLVLAAVTFGGVELSVLRCQPDQGPLRRLAAAAHRGHRGPGHDDLAQGPRDHGAEPDRGRGVAAGLHREGAASTGSPGSAAPASSRTRPRTPPRWRCGPTSSTTTCCTSRCSSSRSGRRACRT